MGDYTEIYINVDLKPETPENIIEVLNAICYDRQSAVLDSYPERWRLLFNDGSVYTPQTSCANLKRNTYYHGNGHYSLIGKGDIKNYKDEIQQFFEWIMPWVDAGPGDFIGYHRFEGDQLPTLVTKT